MSKPKRPNDHSPLSKEKNGNKSISKPLKTIGKDASNVLGSKISCILYSFIAGYAVATLYIVPDRIDVIDLKKGYFKFHKPTSVQDIRNALSKKNASSSVGVLKDEYGMHFIPKPNINKGSDIHSNRDKINYTDNYKETHETALRESILSLCDNELSINNEQGCLKKYGNILNELREEAIARDKIFAIPELVVEISPNNDVIRDPKWQKDHQLLTCEKFLKKHDIPLNSKFILNVGDPGPTIRLIADYDDLQLKNTSCDAVDDKIFIIKESYIEDKGLSTLIGEKGKLIAPLIHCPNNNCSEITQKLKLQSSNHAKNKP